MNNVDWTDYFDRKKIVDIAHMIIDEIIESIHSQKFSIHTRHKLTIDELALLYRWPIYFSVNTFIERFLRSVYYNKTNVAKHYPPVHCVSEYYSTVGGSASAYYHDIEINEKLMHDIFIMIKGENTSFEKERNEEKITYDNNIQKKVFVKRPIALRAMSFVKHKIISFFRYAIKCFFSFRQRKCARIVYEGDKWFSQIFSNKNRFPMMPYRKNYKVNSVLREKLRGCCKTVFENNMHNYIDELDREDREHLLDLFSSWVDHAIPLSLIEGLGDRFNYYRKKLRGWNVKQIHSAIGFYYNDNLKVFSILSKRKNAKLISQDDGIDNFVAFFQQNNTIPNQYKATNQLMFVDYNCGWGKDKLNDKWNHVDTKLNTKVISTGSVYLSKLKKWGKSGIDGKKMTLLFPSCPLRDYMACLEEITPERNYIHRKNCISFIKRLLMKYSGLEVLYKPFPGIDSRNDPLMEVFSEELEQGRVKTTDKHPTELMPEMDIVLFDMISTGFAEAIQIGVPALVFSNRFDYEIASNEGKRINDELENCGVLFYNEEAGIKSFKKVVNDLPSFQESSKEPIKQFQEAVAYPVSAEEFRCKIKKILKD